MPWLKSLLGNRSLPTRQRSDDVLLDSGLDWTKCFFTKEGPKKKNVQAKSDTDKCANSFNGNASLLVLSLAARSWWLIV